MTQCDEARPSCSQCRRGGRKCPGYQSRLKFVDESAKFQGKAGCMASPLSTKAAPELSAVSLKGKVLTHQRSFLVGSNTAAPEARKVNSEISQDSAKSSNVGSLNVLMMNGLRLDLRSHEQEGIVGSFVQDLFPLGQLTIQHSFIGSWLGMCRRF